MASAQAPILVTGAAGFIGHATAHRLLDRGERVIGLDIVNDYYANAGGLGAAPSAAVASAAIRCSSCRPSPSASQRAFDGRSTK